MRRYRQSRAIPRRGAILLAALWLPASGTPVQAQTIATESPLLRLAYVDFFRPDLSAPGVRVELLRSELERYLRLANGDPAVPNVDFSLSPGNHYQVWDWLRSGTVDVGVVSPLMAHLLEEDGVAVPLLEFPGQTLHGSRPVVMARSGAEEDLFPLGSYQSVLHRLLQWARDPVNERPARATLFMASHLSTSGFVAPVLHADIWLQERLAAIEGDTLDTVPVEPEMLVRFWDGFFLLARFNPHPWDEPSVSDADRDVFVFSDLGKGTRFLEEIRQAMGLGDWTTYPIEPPLAAANVADSVRFLVPNQVLVLRNDVACRLAPGLDDSGRSARQCADAINIPGAFRRFQAGGQTRFRARVETVFSPLNNPALAERFRHWYTHGHFEFTVDELFHFLREDQSRANSHRLALVLPGGGVKSVYQAQILDSLYAGCTLVNGHRDPSVECQSEVVDGGADADAGERREEPLLVESIIGTSGGAMVGYLTALQGPDHDDPLAGDAVEMALNPGFRAFDLLRAVSVLFVLALLALFLLFLEPVRPDPARPHDGWQEDWRRAEGRMLPVLRRFSLAWPIVVLPLLVAHIGLGTQETIGIWAASAYGVVVLLVHYAQTTFRSPPLGPVELDAHRAGMSIRQEAGCLAILGAFLILLSLLGPFAIDESVLSVRMLSVLAATGVLSLYTGWVFDHDASGRKVARAGQVTYLRRMPITFLVIAVPFCLFFLFVQLGVASGLELTMSYWVWLTVSSVLVFGPLTVWVTGPQRDRFRPLGRVGGWLRAEMLWLGESDDGGSWWTSPGTRLLALGTVATAVWTLMVAPGLYGNANAQQQLRDKVNLRLESHAHLVDQGGHDPPLHTNLIVTGTLLREARVAGGQLLQEGDFYFCFAGPKGCPSDLGPRWIVGEDEDEDIMFSAVFSSGSPFPVFPAHDARLPDGSSLPLVDGGYAHNVPFEAALLSGARQVLAVRSTPLAEAVSGAAWNEGPRRFTSGLTRGSGRIFGFLFARAQELDRAHARGMFVASIAPTPAPADEPFPVLTSFTKQTVDRLSRMARTDLQDGRRIGRVESWSTPISVEVLRSDQVVGPLLVDAVGATAEVGARQ